MRNECAVVGAQCGVGRHCVLMRLLTLCRDVDIRGGERMTLCDEFSATTVNQNSDGSREEMILKRI
jgi:hypothetical protein